MFYIDEITNIEEFLRVNYYLRSMKKAPHGGVFKVFRPNLYLRYHNFQPNTFVNPGNKEVPYFMKVLHEKAIEIYLQCEEIDMEELLQYCCADHNWYLGMSILIPKEQFGELNQKMHGMLICEVCSKKYKITDFFDVQIFDVIYILLLVLIQDNFNPISSVDEIKTNESLLVPYNKYGLTYVENIEFLRQGFRINEKYYLYNIFLDTTINSPSEMMPYTFRIITGEIKDKQLYLRCDNKLAIPFSEMKATATVDFQKFRGISLSFVDIQSILGKEIVVHIHDELLHKLVMIIKKDTENGEDFY